MAVKVDVYLSCSGNIFLIRLSIAFLSNVDDDDVKGYLRAVSCVVGQDRAHAGLRGNGPGGAGAGQHTPSKAGS